MSNLEPGSVQILFNIYILIRKVFESAFQQYIWQICDFCSFSIRGRNIEKLNLWLWWTDENQLHGPPVSDIVQIIRQGPHFTTNKNSKSPGVATW
jgi:hypothetical protein